MQHRDQVRSAPAEYGDGKTGFPDCLIGYLNRADGTGETPTSDQDAAQMDPWRKLEWAASHPGFGRGPCCADYR